MSKTDLTVLRLSLYELLHQKEIPEKVVLNEAVEIAKKYGGADSGSFVNGVLARILPKLSATDSSEEGERKEKETTHLADDAAKRKKNGRKNPSFHIVLNKKD